MTQVAIALSSLAIVMAAFTLWRNDLRGASLRVNILRTPTEWTSAPLSAVLDSQALLPAQVDPWLFHQQVKGSAELHVIVLCSCSALMLNDGPRGGSIWNIDAIVQGVPAPWEVGATAGAPGEVLAIGPRSTSPLSIHLQAGMRGAAADLEPALETLASSQAKVVLKYRRTQGPFNRSASGTMSFAVDQTAAAAAIRGLLETNATLLDPQALDPPTHPGLAPPLKS